MAAIYHHRRSRSRISYNGGSIGDPDLPRGSCNFRDLNLGRTAPICGCRAFWLRDSRNSVSEEEGWCFCGHHACFHDAFSQTQRSFTLAATNPPVPPEGYEPAQMEHQASSSLPQPTGLGIRPGSLPRTQSIDTRLWDAFNAFARDQEEGPASDTTSKLPSTACPSILGELRPSPTRQMRERAQSQRSMGPPIHIPPGNPALPGPEEYSATEIGTPSLNGTPDMRLSLPAGQQSRPSPPHGLAAQGVPSARVLAQSQQSRVASPRVSARDSNTAATQTTPNVEYVPFLSAHRMQDLLHALGRRVEVLESLSFSHIPIEEVNDRLENFDTRILDLEHWRGDSEQHRSSPTATAIQRSTGKNLFSGAQGSFGSDGSFDSAAALHTEAAVLATLAANAETGPRIDALEDRVADLEHTALPSFARSWSVQVVLLPWGREMRGIWYSALEATQHSLKSSTQMSEEWTGASRQPSFSYKTSTNPAWTTESIQAWAEETQEWLSPKACGPRGIVFKRLASRGLIRNITLTASDSHHILDALYNAFGSILHDVNPNGSELANRFQALKERYIPLRKVRKSSRLRFLSPAEMTTSASWTALFLDSGVMMKIHDGHRRLYLTSPQAYLQPMEEAWSWHKLRMLPMYQPSSSDEVAQIESATIDACWAYHDHLDSPTSNHTSFAPHQSPGSDSAGGSEAPRRDEGLEQLGSQALPSSPHSGVGSVHHRTVSLPTSNSAAVKGMAALPKRRVASFEARNSMTPDYQAAASINALKRRRISASPEAERKGVGFTPRWSGEPPSPFTSEHAGEAQSQRVRGTTPFAYATPHSNTYFAGRVELIGPDGDTEADTDLAGLPSDHGEEEWNGVDDDHDSIIPSTINNPGDSRYTNDDVAMARERESRFAM